MLPDGKKAQSGLFGGIARRPPRRARETKTEGRSEKKRTNSEFMPETTSRGERANERRRLRKQSGFYEYILLLFMVRASDFFSVSGAFKKLGISYASSWIFS